MMEWKSMAKFYRSIGMPQWWISQKQQEFFAKRKATIAKVKGV